MTSNEPIFEIADLQINPTDAATFEAAVGQGAAHFRSARGCLSFELQRSIEHPGQYRLLVGWSSVDAHMVDFRNSAGYRAWRGLVGHFFTVPPVVQHAVQVISCVWEPGITGP